jgi:hypothetical protein
MKHLPLFALAGLAISQSLFAQVYSTPVGYHSHTLTRGFNALGLTLHTPILASGNFETVNGSQLSDTELAFSPVAGRTYILEINVAGNSSLVGTIQEIAAASISGTTITTPDNLGSLGLAAGDTYSLRLAPTFEEVFTTVPRSSGGVLDDALSAGSADIIWIPNGSGGYNQYYLGSGATPEFRNVATNLASPNIPIVYSDGFLIQKKNLASATLVVQGEIKTKKTNSVAVQGFNVLSSVLPTGVNLFNAGLETNMTAALSEGSADILWVQQPDLTYVRYFRRSGAGAGWRVAGSSTTLTQAQAESLSLSSGFLIERKLSTPINISVNVPAGL